MNSLWISLWIWYYCDRIARIPSFMSRRAHTFCCLCRKVRRIAHDNVIPGCVITRHVLTTRSTTRDGTTTDFAGLQMREHVALVRRCARTHLDGVSGVYPRTQAP